MARPGIEQLAPHPVAMPGRAMLIAEQGSLIEIINLDQATLFGESFATSHHTRTVARPTHGRKHYSAVLAGLT